MAEDGGILGMAQTDLRVVSHNPLWSVFYEHERAQLQDDVFGDTTPGTVEIAHVRSTSVPDLPAKPILDIAVAVRNFGLLENVYVPRLAALGYEYKGENGIPNRHLFGKGTPALWTHHLHLVLQGSDHWANHLRFRERLRSDADARRDYADLKARLVAAHPGDRKAYTDGKANFIQGLLNESV